jgi:single-stranded-DNA-specific exonuclease
MEKRWNILEADSAKVTALQTALKIHPILCELLVQRGIEDFDKAKQFFRPSLNDLHDPWLMKDMDKAVKRITKAFDENEYIMVFGDYDVDGTTSVATLYQFLKDIHPTIDFYIPHRYREGYGVSKMGIDHAKATGISLIISVDCGIKSTDLITYAPGVQNTAGTSYTWFLNRTAGSLGTTSYENGASISMAWEIAQ